MQSKAFQSIEHLSSTNFGTITSSKLQLNKINEYNYLDKKYLYLVKPSLNLNLNSSLEELNMNIRDEDYVIFGETEYDNSFLKSNVKSSKHV